MASCNSTSLPLRHTGLDLLSQIKTLYVLFSECFSWVVFSSFFCIINNSILLPRTFSLEVAQAALLEEYREGTRYINAMPSHQQTKLHSHFSESLNCFFVGLTKLELITTMNSEGFSWWTFQTSFKFSFPLSLSHNIGHFPTSSPHLLTPTGCVWWKTWDMIMWFMHFHTYFLQKGKRKLDTASLFLGRKARICHHI